MDKLWESVLKILPLQFTLALAASALALFAIYFGRGYRSYSDAVTDRLFLSVLVLALACAMLYSINGRQRGIGNSRAQILVPRFANDDADQFATAISAQ